MAKEFVGMTPEEIAALPVFPEPEETGGGTVTTDGGTIVADGRGYVYFITESGHTSYFKVGKTGDPNTRCMNLQTGNPRKLKMEARKVANMDTVEKSVLQAMAARYSKTTGGREWFSGDVAGAYNLFLTIVNAA
ncbi:hypothetical protein GBAR_LOCUS30779 [Geodia barretti]|uniref:Bacteriophage T5 Orf172 DNA-binding domain-containing protein n=1 Tax=Geodia barretti TaxID=519541 RepID=A0AA35TXU4_GEOBA|nr:hypothetical protein GBAR_LOCUS30779 [Geodia barretti]